MNRITRESLRDQNLVDRDFSNADIRGMNFINVNLTGVSFRNAIAGQKVGWIAVINLVGILISILAGLICGFSSSLIGILFFGDTFLNPFLSHLSAFAFIIILGIFIVLVIWHGLGKSLGIFTVSLIAFTILIIMLVETDGAAVAAVLPIIVLVTSGASLIGWLLAFLPVYLVSGKTSCLLVIFMALIGIVLGALLGTLLQDADNTFNQARWLSLCSASAIALAILSSSIYIGSQYLAGNYKFSFLGSIVNAWAAIGGTKFHGADLTDADFSYASLKGVDFRKTNLTRTCWYQAQGLDQAMVEGTYLEDAKIRQLLVSKNAKEGIYDNYNLRSVNLSDADLTGASFISSNLSETNLKNADLAHAKLVKTQLYQSDLTNARLTGATIQDWAISTDTNFDNVKCEFVYMRHPTKEDKDPWRKPDNRDETFQDGDFVDFIAPILKILDLYKRQNVDPRKLSNVFKTLDLYHYQGIDPSIAAITLQHLAEKHPESDFQVIAIDGRANDKIRVQTAVSGDIDRSELSAEYLKKYHEFASLSRDEQQALLAAMAEKDERIRSLEKMVTSAIQGDRFYIEYTLGDKVGGDKIGRDKVDVGNISNSSDVAIGKEISLTTSA